MSHPVIPFICAFLVFAAVVLWLLDGFERVDEDEE